ncbi:Proline-specific permease [Colletotrichum aenigma]|uniref:Proline-specific permease n=1 Tax=Colletotrichum aenigma TaxID=1215731 RepID=UPI00187336B6|nr:Proline-specific permease [Colletotrichum aenigma]KAF5502079.1 Proline-specific permease [Colletotrichum aenigma]
MSVEREPKIESDSEAKHSVDPQVTRPESVDVAENRELTTKRGLSSRHAQFIALGGSIGTGLFVSSGGTLARGGPAFLVGSYVVMSALIYMVLTAVVEISTYLPLPGGTMNYYGSRYVSRSLGFMMGWLYFYSFAIFVPFELTASALVIEYWNPNVNNTVWITIMLLLVVGLNLLPVKFYGETEFWFASLKVITIVGLLILSFILFWGGGPSHDRLGFRYWQHPGATKTMIFDDDAGRFVAALSTLLSSVLPFTFSPEMIVVTAGEVQSPRRNLPKIARNFFWRLVVFYIGGTIAISVICPSDASALTNGGSGAASSPWVVGIKNASIKGLDSVINAVIVTAAWSAGNSFLYLASRSLYSMACEGSAPAIFRRCTKQGVPIYAVIASSLFSLLAYMNVNSSAADVFNWLLNLVNTGGIISWVCCGIIYLRFRKACETQQVPKEMLTARSWLQPVGAWISLVVFAILCLLNGFTVFFPSRWSVADFLSAYIGLPLFVVIYFVHRFLYRGDTWAIKSEDVDLQSGLAELEAEEDLEVPSDINQFANVFVFVMEQAKILVVGCGPVGTMCAFALQKSGQATVTAILRSNFDLVKSQGFRIQSVDHGEIDSWRPHNIERTVHDSLQHGPFDYVVVALKNLPDVYSIPNIIAPAVTLDCTSIVLVQNGIDIEQPFVDAFPKTILLSGVPMIGFCALTNMDSGTVQDAGGIETLIRPAMDEVVKIARAAGRVLPSGIKEEMVAFKPKEAHLKPSMQVDAIRGRPMEIEVILGNPIRTARRFEVATPTLVVLYNLLKAKQWQFTAGR